MKPKETLCSAIKKDGGKCKNRATHGDKCGVHSKKAEKGKVKKEVKPKMVGSRASRRVNDTAAVKELAKKLKSFTETELSPQALAKEMIKLGPSPSTEDVADIIIQNSKFPEWFDIGASRAYEEVLEQAKDSAKRLLRLLEK